LACAASLLVVAACQNAGTRQSLLADALRERIERSYVAPFQRGDVAQWTEVFADDALAYHDGPPAMRGREAIRKFGELVHANFEIKVFDVAVDEVRSRGDWAMTAGHYTAHFVPRSADAYAGAAGPRQGKFLFLWERRRGVWQIIADMGNSTDPPRPQ
jgi:ketosteroid isomerase-like protein